MKQQDQRRAPILDYARAERRRRVHWPTAVAVFLVLMVWDSLPRPAPVSAPVPDWWRPTSYGWPWEFADYTPFMHQWWGPDWGVLGAYVAVFAGAGLLAGWLFMRLLGDFVTKDPGEQNKMK